MFGPNITGGLGYVRKGDAGGIDPSGAFSNAGYWNTLVGAGRYSDDWGQTVNFRASSSSSLYGSSSIQPPSLATLILIKF